MDKRWRSDGATSEEEQKKDQERDSFKRRNPRIRLELSKRLRKFACNKQKHMRELLYTISLTVFLFFFSNLASAQTINNSADLEKFYTEYFNNSQSREALVKSYCTDSVYQAWKESESDAPFVLFYCDTYTGVTIHKIPKENQYHVALGFWHPFTEAFIPTASVEIYVDKGKIYKAEPSGASISTSDLEGTKWQLEITYKERSKDYYEFTQDSYIWHYEGGTHTFPYYLSNSIAGFFDHSKVGTGTKGKYLIKDVMGTKDFSDIIYFNKEAGVMIAKPKGGFENYYIMKDKDSALEFFKPREFPVNGPKVSTW